MRNIIFIGGIHGVGKTILCKKVSEELNIAHYSCSELIRKRVALDSVKKNVSDIPKNQNILLEAVEEFCSQEAELILDGHFCLKDKMGVVTNVPIDTFRELQIGSIIVLKSNPQMITKNLMSRDSIIYGLEDIRKFQEQEIVYSREVANFLGIDYIVVDVSVEWNYFIEHVRNLGK